MTTPDDNPWRAPAPPDPDDDRWHAFAIGDPVRPAERAARLAAAAREPAAVAAAVAGALVLLAAPVGLLWARLSPRVGVSFAAQGPSLDQPESSEFFSADGTFLLALVVAGLVSGALAWRLARGRGPAVAVGLALGGLLAGAVAREVGGRVVVDRRLAALCRAGCEVYDGTQQVRAGVVDAVGRSVYLGGFAWSVGALVVLVLLTAALDRDPEPAGPRSPTLPDWPPPSV